VVNARQLLGLLALSAGCTQVLGIEDAHVDTALSGGKGGGGSVSGNLSTSAGSEQDTAGAPGEPAGTGGTSGGSGTGGRGGGGGSDAVTMSGAPAEDGGAPAVTTSPCETYCDAVMTNCKGKYEQYRSFDQCIEVCKRLPEGTSGDEGVNSVQCRVRQAREAKGEPFVYCKAAGPLGAGKCGSNCVSYCSLMQATCTPESTKKNLELSYYSDSQACLAACGSIPTHEDDPAEYSSSTNASPSCFVGNTVYCRTYHIASALEQDTPDEHCPHAMGGDPCNEP
jgi:hypothetical protein